MGFQVHGHGIHLLCGIKMEIHINSLVIGFNGQHVQHEMALRFLYLAPGREPELGLLCDRVFELV